MVPAAIVGRHEQHLEHLHMPSGYLCEAEKELVRRNDFQTAAASACVGGRWQAGREATIWQSYPYLVCILHGSAVVY